jgi:hypothetical protein
LTIQIRFPDDSSGRELSELRSWLLLEPALRGRVTLVPAAPDPEKLGGVWDALAVALGSGGAGAALSGALSAWLARRRQDTKIEIDLKNDKYTFLNMDSQKAKEILEKIKDADDAES